MALTLSQKAYRLINKVLSQTIGMRLVRAVPKVNMAGYSVSQKPAQPLYLNVGAGKWRHPLWHNMDHPVEGYEKSQGNTDIPYNLMSDAPFGVEENSLLAAFTSHTIEHIDDASTLRMFQNVYRSLKPGGTFRVTCPDVALAYSAYQRKDTGFWAPYDKKHTLEQLFLSVFSASCSTLMETDPSIKVCDEEVRRVFSEMPMEEALDHFTKNKPLDLISRHPQSHDTWYTVDKVSRMLREAGFGEVWESRYGQSYCEPMRDLGYFDTTRPDISLFVECRK